MDEEEDTGDERPDTKKDEEVRLIEGMDCVDEWEDKGESGGLAWGS